METSVEKDKGRIIVRIREAREDVKHTASLPLSRPHPSLLIELTEVPYPKIYNRLRAESGRPLPSPRGQVDQRIYSKSPGIVKFSCRMTSIPQGSLTGIVYIIGRLATRPALARRPYLHQRMGEMRG